MIAAQRQVDALRRQGRGGGGAVGLPNPAYLSIKSMQAERAATVQALQTRKAQLQADLNAMSSRQTDEPGLAAEQEKLDRDYEVLKTQYDKLLADREDVRLRGDVKTETGSVQFRVINPPSAPTAPVAPNRPLLLLGVLIVGIGAGVGSAFAMGQLKGSFPTAARLALLLWLALLALCVLLILIEFIQRGMA